MIINTERLPHANILTPAVRRLDASVAATFKASVTEEIGDDRKALIVDFSKVDFIDSSGLGMLVSLFKLMNGKGEMALCSLNPGIMNMFMIPHGPHIPHLSGQKQRACAAGAVDADAGAGRISGGARFPDAAGRLAGSAAERASRR